MGKMKVVLILLLLIVAVTADAAPVEKVQIGLRDVVETVEQSYRQLQDVSADFFQRSTLAENQRELRADGELFIRPPTGRDPVMFRFDYFRPTTQQVVCDGRKLWVYLPANRQVILSDVSVVLSPFGFDPQHPERSRAGNFLQGLGRISQDFAISFSPQMQDVQGNFVLELTPRRATAFISKIFMVVRHDSVDNYVRNRSSFTTTNRPELLFPILSTTMVDHQDNTTTMELSNFKVNRRLPTNMFEFLVPAGAEVVRPPTGPGR